MSDLVEWVSDSLHDILGMSDRFTAEFLVGLAKKSSSLDGFLRKLKDTGAIAINERVTSFASELWEKTPRQKADRYQATRDKEKVAYLLQQKNKSYRLLSDDDDADDDQLEKRSRPSKKSSKQRKEKERESEKEGGPKKRKNIRKQKASGWESESEEEQSHAKRSRANSDSDEWEKYVHT